jgi:tRNA threonylcarbamoyladenosine biosynthesis protein TsaE
MTIDQARGPVHPKLGKDLVGSIVGSGGTPPPTPLLPDRPMPSYRTDSAAATQQLAHALAGLARPGDLVLLVGEMGAGKTAFAQGFAVGLGVAEQVTSPTFTLVRHYEGRLPLHHIDVYRLETMSEVADLGLSELLDSDGVTLIEWGDAIRAALPPDQLEVSIAFGDQGDDRLIEIRALGSWSARQRIVREALEAWQA